MILNTNLHWNAVCTRPNYEKKVCTLLRKKGINCYCPLGQTITGTSYYKKQVTAPLFPSLVFIQLPAGVSFSVLKQVPSIINVLYYRSSPAVFPAAEIDTLRHFLEAQEIVTVTKMPVGVSHHSIRMQETPITRYSKTENYYTLDLPSIGYSLTAKANPIMNIKLVGKTAGLQRTTEKLAFMFGFRSNSRKFQ